VDEKLKQRLVGAAVLIALAVIFLPMLFDHPETEGGGTAPSTRVPPEPDFTRSMEVKTLDLPPPPPVPVTPDTEPGVSAAAQATPAGSAMSKSAEPKKVEPKKAEPKKAEPKKAEPKKAEPKKAEPKKAEPGPAEPKPVAAGHRSAGWVVQVASFARRANALALQSRLRRAGFTTYIEPVDKGGRRHYRVRVGPEIKRPAAVRLQQRIADRLHLKGIVVHQ